MLEPVFQSDFPPRKHPHGGDPHRGSALNSSALMGMFHADRSEPGRLAVRYCTGNSGFCRDLCRWRALVRAPLDKRYALNFSVRGTFRVLDLFPAPRAAVAENDHAPECADHDGSAA